MPITLRQAIRSSPVTAEALVRAASHAAAQVLDGELGHRLAPQLSGMCELVLRLRRL
ncbi:hypothetical protein ABZ807_24905 [Micromonospora sp. NPDC047548]|uniref:hypothetical protein n=1 Tax=Micromonospora sp. NPDC047548 TaxID=3155624 RepID=UPI0033F233AC